VSAGLVERIRRSLQPQEAEPSIAP
jgi:hypothetical protein